MIRQQVGDVLEINFENGWYYVVNLTKIFMLSGNVVFAYHNDGKKMQFDELKELDQGFNICTDLLWVKRQGLVKRLGRFDKVDNLLQTKYMKGCHEIQKGEKAKRWFIYSIDHPGPQIAVVSQLSDVYEKAMDMSTFSFDLVAEKILKRYTPDQNEHI